MSPVAAAGVFILLFGMALWPIVGETLARRRNERTRWKKHIPQQRGNGMTKGARDLFLSSYAVSTPAPTDTDEVAA